MTAQNSLFQRYMQGNLILFIAIGIVIGAFIGYFFKSLALEVGILGSLFVGSLKAVAPMLVFVLVLSSIANRSAGKNTKMSSVVILYLIGTFIAALTAVVASFLFPTDLALTIPDDIKLSPPGDVIEVLKNLLFKMTDNPVHALVTANYIGILTWAVALGLVLHNASDSTKVIFSDLAHGVSQIVKLVIRFAPFGICGLVATTVAETGFTALLGYSHLLAVLLGSMIFVALVLNPALVYWKTKKNPYPLVFTCLRESGTTAFFTRSSAANIPVNMDLCERLKLDEDIYSVSIPLGATINMAGAAVTITVLTLAAAHHLHISIDLPTALLLSLVSALSACGASGVAGGSLLLIPLACSLFGIPNDVAMQVVGAGFIIGVIQDSAETALNSSTDVLFTAAVCRSQNS